MLRKISITARIKRFFRVYREGIFTTETQVVRKNRNLRFCVVAVDRQFFHSQETPVFSRCVDPSCLSSA